MAAIESAGVYWKPLYTLFRLMDLGVMVVNTAHMKAVPGWRQESNVDSLTQFTVGMGCCA